MRSETRRTTPDPDAGVLVHTRVDSELDVTEWLLQAADDPARARAEWQTMDVALLRCGVHFTAIRVPAAVVFAAARSEDRARADEYLAAALHGGPVFVDRQSGRYYCLVPAGDMRHLAGAGHSLPHCGQLPRGAAPEHRLKPIPGSLLLVRAAVPPRSRLPG